MNTSEENVSQSTQNQDNFLMCHSMPAGLIINAAVILADAALGLPLYIWALWLLVRSRSGSVTSEVFVLCLASVDLVSYCFWLLDIINLYYLKRQSIDYTWRFISGFLLLGRPLCQSCLCLERYMAVAHPIAFLKYKALRYKLPCIAVIWMLAVMMGIFYNYLPPVPLNVSVFVTALSIESFCSLSILRVLKQPQPGDRERQEMSLMKRKAFNIVLVIQLMLVFNYFPVIIALPFKVLFGDQHFECFLEPVSFSFAMFGTFIYPLLHLYKVGKLPSRKFGKRR